MLKGTKEELDEHICNFYPCSEAYSGCDFRGTNDEVRIHKLDCKYSKCINEKHGCRRRGTWVELYSHEADCGFALMTCGMCRLLFRKNEIEPHQKLCESNSAECYFCQKLIHGDLYQTHLAICEKEIEIAKCLICHKYCLKSDIGEHVLAHEMSQQKIERKIRNYDDG